MKEMDLADKIDAFNLALSSGVRVVFFGGAGVSTESGIPDFRGTEGIFSIDSYLPEPPETILSHSFFVTRTAEFFQFYRKNMVYPDAAPNAAHYKLSEMERVGLLSAVITQNVDGLHQRAGSENVVELHGSIYRNYCVKCGKNYDIGYVMAAEGVPLCPCGGIVRPDVVLYEEGLKQREVEKSIKLISEADILVIGGTSLEVYPAAGLVRYYQGSRLVIINKSRTDYDSQAWLVMRDGIARVMADVEIPDDGDEKDDETATA